eukprot:GHVU01173590.1.p1 GENE.GHVU01173590.1~~GHVU01173590.1.p1  ORF type:complete len:140 (+),score=9.01 GHVU01173590.1:142-561(+)
MVDRCRCNNLCRSAVTASVLPGVTDAQVPASHALVMMLNVSDISDGRMPVIIYDARYKVDIETVKTQAIEVPKTKEGEAILRSIKKTMKITQGAYYLVHVSGSEGYRDLAQHSWKSEPDIVSVIVANRDGAYVVRCTAC